MKKLNSLKIVSSTIVALNEGIGVYHLNKLTYLFEYFFIKNFGRRYTGEKFVKLPHGPVIQSVTPYKDLISSLAEQSVIDTDVDEISKNRKLDDDYIYRKIPIKPKNVESSLLTNPFLLDLAKNVVFKFGNLGVNDLEEFVYKTRPVVNYENNPYKKDVGGYVIVSDNIRLGDYKTETADYHYNLLKYYEDAPRMGAELHGKYSEEFSFLEKLRPESIQELEG